ncbi:hypothetical protein GTW40_10775 [Streptomyces sp. SID4985]|uniref:DUF6233 domain-containing protein n=1 Tax=Streptomyces sp. SID4985 TaxID=2690292 RepID=UPI00136CCAE3|nr:DUF6233 domain-containing protein [Streptomyces sp. SID4985]MYQ45539.1 hypothetical protein [Streptomyces sp. SID4985]
MSDLPPDPPRPRAILAHLDRQITDNDTVGTYLRIRRNAVHNALAQADPPTRQRPVRRAKGSRGPGPAAAHSSAATGYVVQHKRTPNGHEPAIIHLATCVVISGASEPVRANEARAALTEPTIEPCTACRPDTPLGMEEA